MKKFLYITLALAACNNAPENNGAELTPPSEWVKNATIYEVNVRQFSNEGTFDAFEKRLPKLKELGVDILWFMPIQPIGKVNRKAVGDTFVQDLENPDYDKYWGSPYSIADYTAVNPRYGSLEDFKRVVGKAHEMEMKVILDWVGNHTAWDNSWVSNHPEWYTVDSSGNITDPIGEDGKSWGWTDVADLNYDNKEMRTEMIKSMQFWIEECDIDGLRCDVAMEVPTDFWNEASSSLNKVKPIFMLAESEAHKPDQFDSAFDAYYGWEMHHVFNKLYKGEVATNEVERVMKTKDSIIGTKAFPMNMITNHDENSWNGTIEERLGESWKAMALLSYTLRGMPLIYNGQEAGLNHRLSFFAKDSINWNAPKANEYFEFYKELNKLKEEPAFATNSSISFDNEKENKDLLIINRGSNNEYKTVINLSKNEWRVLGHDVGIANGYTQVLLDNLSNEGMLGSWGYIVLKKEDN
ncbi:MAG: alpha-amylase [Bacteroidia bacterium]|nr:alpha-amylase [Bacteroidia bacterium]